MIFNLQNTIIAAVISFVFGVLLSGFLVYSYETSENKAEIARISKETTQKYAEELERVSAKEREGQNAVNSLNTKNASLSQELDVAKANLRKYRSINGGLLIKPGNNQAGDPATPQPSCGAANSQGATELRRDFSDFLETAVTKLDKCIVDLNTAKDYAQLINQYREEQTKNAK